MSLRAIAAAAAAILAVHAALKAVFHTIAAHVIGTEVFAAIITLSFTISAKSSIACRTFLAVIIYNGTFAAILAI